MEVADHLHLARTVAARLGGTDETLQACLIGLWHACRTWDEATGVPFVAWARMRMRWQVAEEQRTHPKVGRKAWAAQEPTAVAVGYPTGLIDERDPDRGTPDPADLVLRVMDSDRLIDLVWRLPSAEREVVAWLYWAGQTGVQTAARLGVSERTVSVRKAKALARLRAMAGDVRDWVTLG